MTTDNRNSHRSGPSQYRTPRENSRVSLTRVSLPVGSTPTRSTRSRGQSEVIGFALLFALVISAIGATIALGGPALLDAQNTQSELNIERAYQQTDRHLSATTTAPTPQELTLTLPDGRLALDQQTNITISTAAVTHNVSSDPLVYTPPRGQTEHIYDGGLYIREDGNTSQQVQAPSLTTTTAGGQAQTSFTFYQTTAAAPGYTGPREFIVLTNQSGSAPTQTTTVQAADNPTITVTSPAARGWETVFTESPVFTGVSRTNQTVTADYAPPSGNGELTFTAIEYTIEE